MLTNSLKLVGFAGSLRRGSLNRLLLRAAIPLAPEGMTIEEVDKHDIPLFDADTEEQPPQSVVDFKESIAASNGLLIVTPEYNYGIPAVTKNLIDWASRRNSPPGNVLLDKPVSIMTIVGGVRGRGMYAQRHVRDVLVFPRAVPMPFGDVGVNGGQSNFDDDGKLVNEEVMTQLRQNLEAFARWIRRVTRGD